SAEMVGCAHPLLSFRSRLVDLLSDFYPNLPFLVKRQPFVLSRESLDVSGDLCEVNLVPGGYNHVRLQVPNDFTLAIDELSIMLADLVVADDGYSNRDVLSSPPHGGFRRRMTLLRDLGRCLLVTD